MLNDEEAKQLIEDVKQMTLEMHQVAQNGRDSAGRLRAKRWLSTLVRMADYVDDCTRGRRR